MRKILALFAVILAVSGVAMAIPQNATVTATDLGRWVPSGVADNRTTEGGNITEANLTAQAQLTDRWAGFFGQVTEANIILAAAGDTNYLYTWAGNLTTGGEVCVSTDPAFGWATVVSALDSDIETAWAFGAVLDSAAATYNTSGCAMNFTGVPVANTNNSDQVNSDGLSSFYTCVFSDTGSPAVKNDLAFCAQISDDATGYDGATVDYELIVPTNDSPDGTETYYFFVELG